MVYFDLDGVIRFLSYNIRGGRTPQYWSEPLPSGEDMCEYIHKNLNVLEEAPVTKYYHIIKNLPSINIITNQFDTWKKPTLNWIHKHLDNHKISIQYANPTEKKLDLIGSDSFIVEDYPFFNDYSRVALIDWPYNRNVESPYIRIKTEKQLENFLMEHYQ